MRIISSLEALPVELIADILSELDLDSLVTVSYLSKRLFKIASDSALNPWRKPISRSVRSGQYAASLRTLSNRTIVPQNNWIDILTLANPDFLLLDATLPNLPEAIWEECFMRRFLPGWIKWRRDGRWRRAFVTLLFRMSHRTSTHCTTDETWTKYIVLNRNGTANQLQSSSRSFDPLVIFNEMKLQSNLMHLETHVRLVVQLTDVRILAFGVLNKPRSTFSINENARAFLHPPGINKAPHANSESGGRGSPTTLMETSIVGLESNSFRLTRHEYDFEMMTHPQPALSHRNYPFHTPGGRDRRWVGNEIFEEHGMHWVGGLLIVAQLFTSAMQTHVPTDGDGHVDQDFELVVGQGRSHYASFIWPDLDAIAPWMEDRIVKRIEGQGLGL